MAVPGILRTAFSLRWQLKVLLPIVGVLLVGLITLEGVLFALEIPNGHWILFVAATGAVMISGVLLTVLVALIGRPLQELEKTITRVQGGDLSARVRFANQQDDLGQLGCHFNAMVEQLRQNRIEIERLHQREMARAEHLATMGELAAGLAHEIRNPLAGIAGVVEIMGKDLPPESPSRAILGDVQDEIRHIQTILNDLLAYSRPRSPEFHAADLNATVEQAVHLARQQVRTKPIAILFAPQSGLPEVVHDPAQIQQVVLNLLLNGTQAIPGEGQVDASLRQEGDQVVVRVADTGCGISRDVLTKIFKPFFTTRKEGTGLGLSLAKGIVDSHNGRIEVKSEPGRGSQFEVWLPIRRAGESARSMARVVE